MAKDKKTEFVMGPEEHQSIDKRFVQDGGKMRRATLAAIIVALSLSIVGCSSSANRAEVSEPKAQTKTELQETPVEPQDTEIAETEADTMRMSIGKTDVTVEWESNQAVADLQALVADAPLTVNLSMYGGFEQVGPLGTYLTSNDVQTTTAAGDIVLYSGNQIVLFYGSNSWAYTRLGHITSQSAEGMANLLGNGDVSITITSGRE